MRKPAPLIFRLAADQAALELDEPRMIGDSAEADIGGAHCAGISSVWLHRQRAWSLPDFRPTKIMGTCVEASLMPGR